MGRLMRDVDPGLKHLPWVTVLEPTVEAPPVPNASSGDVYDEVEQLADGEDFLARIGAVRRSSHKSNVLEEGNGYNLERVMNFLQGHEYESKKTLSGVNWRDLGTEPGDTEPGGRK